MGQDRATPIVLHHGLLGFGELRLGKLKLTYYNGVDLAFEKLGHPLIVPHVHPTSSIEKRARQLRTIIRKNLRKLDRPKDRVVIFAHSMGGLDARYMIHKLDMADQVAALVTISTPHHGSAYADWCLKNLDRVRGLQVMRFLGLDVDACNDLTIESCARFNEKITDAPGVRYFSISASRPWHRVPPLFYHSHKVISAAQGANDGLVAVESAKWGEHLETWPADHLHVVNRRFVVEIKNKTGDVTPRYLKVLERMKTEGAAL
jgi:triacylglycerol lipase